MTLLTGRRLFGTSALFAAGALAVMALALTVGAEPIDPWRALGAWWRTPADTRPPEATILMSLRLPRVLLAFLAGAGLAAVGAAFQAVLRNPLAEPYTLGVSGGGSLGAVLAIFLPRYWPALAFSFGPIHHLQCFAFAGALGAVAIIYGLARRAGGASPVELLLAGVTLGMICSALIMAVRYFADPDLLIGMDRWLMGGLDVGGFGQVWPAAVLTAIGAAMLAAQARGYDLIALGEELARGRGLDVARLQRRTLLAGSLITAAVVAVAGPIGFVGIMAPHLIRRWVGADHRLLLPCAFFGGGAFLVACDAVARTVLAPTELPVGVITALLGGPFFLSLLVRARRGGQLW